MWKFDFSVQTREGQKIASIMIMGKDRPDAERKLFQMYRHCQILRCDVRQPGERQRRVFMLADENTLPLFARHG